MRGMMTMTMTMTMTMSSPTKDAKDKIKHEEGSDDDEGDEENPIESVSKCVVRLQWEQLQWWSLGLGDMMWFQYNTQKI